MNAEFSTEALERMFWRTWQFRSGVISLAEVQLYVAKRLLNITDWLTLGYSKKLRNLQCAVAIQIAFHNFCRRHGTLGKTPAMAAGLTDRVWSINELLKS